MYNLIENLNCTKEIYTILDFSKKLVILQNETLIKPLHIFISLILKSNLIKIFLQINNKNIENLLLNIFIYNTKNLNKHINLSKITFSKEVLEIFTLMQKNNNIINTLSLFYNLIKLDNYLLNQICIILNLNSKKIFQILNKLLNSSHKILEIPYLFKNILSLSNNSSTDIIFERDKEINLCNEILSRNINKNPILVGPEGVGKYSIILKLSSLNSNKIYLTFNILNLLKEANNIVFINNLFNYIINLKNIVLICKDISLLFDKNNTEINYLKNIFINCLIENKIQIIGTSTLPTYEKLISEEFRLKSLFTKLIIKELPEECIFKILKQNTINLTKHYNIHITNKYIIDIINLSNIYIKNAVFPKKGLLLLDNIYANAKFNNNKNKEINYKNIISCIADYSELPIELIDRNYNISSTIKNLETYLNTRIFGQDIALVKIITSIKRTFTGLKDKSKPIGSWLLCGPSGTGKTEIVKSLAHSLFGSESEMIRFDMSEFMEKHSVSKLIGPPPGYIGFESGGLLTEAVKKKPFTVILFDEIEKAHKDINNIMLQLLDEGTLTDSLGNKVDFSNTLIIFTSNLGCPTDPNEFKSFKYGIEVSTEEYKYLSKKVDTAVKQFFRPEFLNRLDDIIVFKPLSILTLNFIVSKFINNIIAKLKINNILLQIDLSNEIKLLLAKLAYHPLYGARPLKRLIENFIEKPITEILLNYKFSKSHLLSIFLNKTNNEINYLLKQI